MVTAKVACSGSRKRRLMSSLTRSIIVIGKRQGLSWKASFTSLLVVLNLVQILRLTIGNRTTVQQPSEPMPQHARNFLRSRIRSEWNGQNHTINLYRHTSETWNKRLVIIIPFRESTDSRSQGMGRERNLHDWLTFMGEFLGNNPPAKHYKVLVVEQTSKNVFNKGFLFNVGYVLVKEHCDYMVLHDVDQIPVSPSNDYSYRTRPTKLLSVRLEETLEGVVIERPVFDSNVGGALMITKEKYEQVNGYSNSFGGWGMEDDNMAMRLDMHGGYDVLDVSIGAYMGLKHDRIIGLDETVQYRMNQKMAYDMTSGLSDLSYNLLNCTTFTIMKWELNVSRCLVEETADDDHGHTVHGTNANWLSIP